MYMSCGLGVVSEVCVFVCVACGVWWWGDMIHTGHPTHTHYTHLVRKAMLPHGCPSAKSMSLSL